MASRRGVHGRARATVPVDLREWKHRTIRFGWSWGVT
jgi:hypothetical protein